MEKKATNKAFVIGARPPQTLSSKAKRQLSSAKPSKKALKLAENAGKVLAATGGVCLDKAGTAPARTSRSRKKKSVSVK
ncbi:hypothetical protein [Geobacter anodireducens]